MPAILTALESAAISPSRIEQPLQRHPHADQMQAVLMLLVVFALASLAVAASFIGNLVTVALRSEERLIGIQKAIGATNRRITVTTLMWIAAIAIPAALLGTFLGQIGAHSFLAFAAHELNLADQSLSASLPVLIAAGLLGGAAPLFVTWIVTRRAAQIAPLAAINSDRDLAPPNTPRRQATSVARAYAQRHLGRAPMRLGLMLLALSLGGAAVISAGTVYSSLSAAVDRVFLHRSDDLDIRLLVPAPREQLVAAMETEGVQTGEVWGFLLVAIGDEDTQATGARFGLLSPLQNSEIIDLPMAEGRWLGDPAAPEIVASRNLLARYPSLRVGSDVVLAAGDARITAQIVGAVEEATEPGIYATQSVHNALAVNTGLAGALRLTTTEPAAIVAARVEERLFSEGLVPIFVFDRAELQLATKGHFIVLLILLSTVGAAALIVGGMALWSSITVAILERQREIAVIRAVGATDRQVMKIFGIESVGLAVLALALSIAIAFVLSTALVGMLGQGALFIDIPLQPSGLAFIIWIITLALIVVLATWLPLRRVLAVPPSQGLRYE